MIGEEKLLKISQKLTSDKDNYISSLRKNLFMYVDDKDITLKEISEQSDVPFSTLNSFLYGNTQDIKLSTVVKLAKALHVSIDELVGSETISPTFKKCMADYRNLQSNDRYLVRWFAEYLCKLKANEKPNRRYISVMQLDCDESGSMKITSNYKRVDVTDIKEEYRHKVFFGITMPYEHYMPLYSPYDILLIANNREPKNKEVSLVRINKNFALLKKIKENGMVNYYSIRDGKFRMNEKDISEDVGYVAYVLR